MCYTSIKTKCIKTENQRTLEVILKVSSNNSNIRSLEEQCKQVRGQQMKEGCHSGGMLEVLNVNGLRIQLELWLRHLANTISPRAFLGQDWRREEVLSKDELAGV